MPTPHVPELREMEELVEEILIRLPPDEPENLVRASLVCKSWCRILSDRGFRSRYRAFHQTPPMLGGFLQTWGGHLTLFLSTTEFLPRDPDPDGLRHFSVSDRRHGRILLSYWDRDEKQECFLVWDPMTGSTTSLREPEKSDAAAVLCAADRCDHGACHMGPFLVVSFSIDEDEGVVRAYVYSSEAGSWSSPASLDLGFFETGVSISDMPSVLAGGALYFLFWRDYIACTLKYDVGSASLSEIDVDIHVGMTAPFLIAAEDGGLRITEMYKSNLTMWSRKAGPDGVEVWTENVFFRLN